MDKVVEHIYSDDGSGSGDSDDDDGNVVATVATCVFVLFFFAIFYFSPCMQVICNEGWFDLYLI